MRTHSAERINNRIEGLRRYLRLMNDVEKRHAEKLIHQLARTRAGIKEGQKE